MRLWCVILGWVLLLPSLAFGQEGFGGYRTYPGFRSSSGLPGGGFTVSRSGMPFAPGAMALSSPIAYGLRPGTILLHASLLNFRNTIPPFGSTFTTRGASDANGTGAVMVAFGDEDWGSLTYSIMFLSAVGDNVGNVHYQIPLKNQNWALGVGIQDVSGTGGTSGDNNPGNDEISRSVYGVVSIPLNQTTLSFGTGTLRFRRGFASVSHQVNDRMNVMTEYDSYNINLGIGYSLGKGPRFLGRTSAAYVSGGSVRGKYPFLGFSIAF